MTYPTSGDAGHAEACELSKGDPSPVDGRLRVADQRLRQFESLGGVGFWEWDEATDAITWSESLSRLYAVEPVPTGLTSTTAIAMIDLASRQEVATAREHCMRSGAPARLSYTVSNPLDGRVRSFEERADRLPGPGPSTVIGAVVDITDRVVAKEEATSSRAFYDAVLTASPDYTFVARLDDGFVVYRSRVHDVLERISETVESLDTEAMAELVHQEDRLRLSAANIAARDADDGSVLQTRYRSRHLNGEWRWLSRRMIPFRRDSGGTVVEVLGVVHDVTDTVQAESSLTHAALHDGLTGLPNRTLLVDRLEVALSRSARDNREVAVLFCDLDGFKRINDSGGHLAGDAVLVETARRLGAVVREGDTVARVGGDEFVLILEPWNRSYGTSPTAPRTHSQDRQIALELADRLIMTMRDPVGFGGASYIVTVSVGIAFRILTPHTPRPSAQELVQDADAAMYRAKNLGKDRCAVFEGELRSQLVEHGRLEQLLQQALRDRQGTAAAQPRRGPQLTASYQPIFDAQSNTLVGFEALARLRDVDGLQIPPEQFVPVAEAAGIIRPLGALMLELACEQLASWRAQMAGLESVTMGINLSAHEAAHGDLEQLVRSALQRHDLSPQDLMLELTETVFLHAGVETISALRNLRRAGVGLAIDDFGTGYASLKYLATLPVTAIKIDRAFTERIPADRTNLAIVESVAGLAMTLGLACIVEGIETAVQLAALPPGVQIQGWLTGRPQEPAHLDVEKLVLRTA
jgi:diguanylate cyclase (GGDEF)-like protein